MALKPPRTQRARTVGHISHDASVRVDQRVKEILARREAAVERERAAPRDASTAGDRGHVATCALLLGTANRTRGSRVNAQHHGRDTHR
jgi:hypothetical protein